MPTFEIVDFAPNYAAAFDRLNREWLETYFRVEPIDQLALTDPQAAIIDPGGAILFARAGDDIQGTVALKHHGEKVFELTKMAVTPGAQGLGIGRALLCAAIGRYASLRGKCLYLESHSSLTTAIRLYERAGFVHAEPPALSEYARADVYMIYRDS